MKVIERDALEGITSVEVDGVEHQLGLVKDLRQDPAFARLVPERARLSLSWVRLAAGQELAVHRHPTASMIVVTEGSGRVLGEIEGPIRAGDAVVVPPNCDHGFVGSSPDGFWGLSIQFEGGGLYEDPDAPRTTFGHAPVDAVRDANDQRMRAYEDSPLVTLVGDLRSHPDAVRERLLGHLQTWSDGFQRIIAMRAAAEGDTRALALAHEHLAEELGHNGLLAQTRGERTARWDPVIAAVSAWFVDRMAAAGSVERTVLAHLVLEGSGLVFHRAGRRSFPGSRYFELHDSADVEHLEMGYRALAQRDDWTLADALTVLDEGWRMMTLMSDRIAQRALPADT